MSTEEKIAMWFSQKGLDKKENRFKQLAKTTEELGELAECVVKDKPEDLALEIGDVAVTLIGLTTQFGLDYNDCLEQAYKKISKRKGQTKGGVFVKSEDS